MKTIKIYKRNGMLTKHAINAIMNCEFCEKTYRIFTKSRLKRKGLLIPYHRWKFYDSTPYVRALLDDKGYVYLIDYDYLINNDMPIIINSYKSITGYFIQPEKKGFDFLYKLKIEHLIKMLNSLMLHDEGSDRKLKEIKNK